MTPKAKAQEALDDLLAEISHKNYTLDLSGIDSIREALALAAALERVPDNKISFLRLSDCWQCSFGYEDHIRGHGKTPAAAILAAVEKMEALEKHAAAVKRGEV